MSESAIAEAGGQDHGVGHVLPVSLLVKVWGALVVMTLVTVGMAQVDLGIGNVVIALMIATVKATIVALFFMHLRWDKKFHALIIIASMFFALLFIFYVLMDTWIYQSSMHEYANSLG